MKNQIKAEKNSSGEAVLSPPNALPQSFRRHPLSIAWDEWMESDEGKDCHAGSASGVYLYNRLNRAFMAGAKAQEDKQGT